MEFGGKARDAIKLMIHVAVNVETEAVVFSDILKRLDIRSENLCNLMWRLWAHGLLQLQFGEEFSLKLPRPAREINIAEIVVAADDPAVDDGNPVCTRTCDGLYRLQQILHDYLETIDLSQLIERNVPTFDAAVR